jgi:HK97 family phage portal protein
MGLESFGILQSRNRPLDPADANEGSDNAIVNICINYIVTSWQQAYPVVGTWEAGEFIPAPDATQNPIVKLFKRPNDHYSGQILLWSMLNDYWKRGNAYAHLTKNGRGEIVSIEWIPTRYIRPIPGSDGYLSHYNYNPMGRSIDLDPEDMLHIQFGIDEQNPLQGVSPLAAMYREIITDNAYSDYAGGNGQNGGLPQVVFSPKEIKDSSGMFSPGMTPEQADAVSARLRDKMKAEPGKPRLLPAALDMHVLSHKPDEMALLDVRAMPETRIPAAFGLPALVLQLYTGVQKSTFANLETAVRQAWYGCIIPTQRVFAEEITYQILQRQGGPEADLSFHWDVSQVRELQDDKNALRKSSREDVAAGIITVEEARTDQGRETTPAVLAELEKQKQPPVDPNANPDAPEGSDDGGQEDDGEEDTVRTARDASKMASRLLRLAVERFGGS